MLHNELRNKELDSCTHLDLGYSFTDETYKGVIECIERHWNTFGDHVNQFCVFCVLAPGEGSLKYVIRRKFSAWPYLPDPMPNQSVWLIDKKEETAMFLWALPKPELMAELSETFGYVGEYSRMKVWCDAFFKGFPSFWNAIRKMHKISFLSESEFNSRNRKLGGKYVDDKVLGLNSNSSYLPEVKIKKLEAMSDIVFQQLDNNLMRQPN